MFRSVGRLCLLPVVALVCAGQASATTIDFENHYFGQTVGTNYVDLGVTFTNTRFAPSNGLYGTSGNVAVYSQSADSFLYGLADAIAGTFTSSASYVSFSVSDVGAAGARLDGFDALGALIASSTVANAGLGHGNADILAITGDGIVSFKVYQPFFNNMDGMIVDNMSFTSSSDVPEPASWAMMVGGFGLLGASMRRRQRTSVRFA